MGERYELDITVNLAELGLAHAPGSACKCDGRAHPVSINIKPEEHDLHREDDCPALDYPDVTEAVLQSLHEQAHPDGTVFTENCREAGCLEARELL
jgi:hypothetical protein